VCAWLELGLDGNMLPALIADEAWAWHTFSHEAAHALGYDHGEKTVGADCVGYRRMALLMKRAGIPRWFRQAVRAELRPLHYCR
jgi:hypothetical protein